MHCNIILVNWRRALDTCDCIDSLEGIEGVEWSAVICENGSLDDSEMVLRGFLADRYEEVVRESGRVIDYFTEDQVFPRRPRVTLVISSKNLGFAGGNNLAFQHAVNFSDTDFFWFLNNDTRVDKGALRFMVDRMQSDARIGICGSTLIFAHDCITVQALGGAIYSKWTGSVSELGQGLSWPVSVDNESIESAMRYVSGASMLVSRDFVEKVGLMCEDYFLYYEEIDWAERARRAGFRLGYAKDAVVYHKEGAVLGSGKSVARSALAEYYGVRNRLVITRRFFPWAMVTVYLFSMAQILKRCAQGNWARARMMAAVLFGIRRDAPLPR